MNIAVYQDPQLNIIPNDNMQQTIKFMITQFLDANGNQPADIEAISTLVHDYNKDIVVVVDNTFLTPYNQVNYH